MLRMTREADPELTRAAWRPGEDRIRALQEELSLAASRAPDFGRALLVMLRRLCGELDWDFGEAWVRSRDGSVLKQGPVWPRSNIDYLTYRKESRRIGFLPGVGMPGIAWQTRRPIAIANLDASSGTSFTRRMEAMRTGFRHVLAIPILSGEEDVVAVLMLYRSSGPGVTSEEMDQISHTVAPLGPIVAQKQVEVELAARERQQKAVAQLGMEALADRTTVNELLARAASLTATTLDVAHCKVVECMKGVMRLRMRAGVGWDGTIDEIPGENRSQAGYTINAGEPVIVSDLDRETRFTPSDLVKNEQIVSGLSAIIYGKSAAWGVIAVHSRQRRSFTPDDIHFLQSIANVLGTTIERKRVEEELHEHREHLETLIARRTSQLDKSHERLRLAERLAAVGTLAAGLGHDLGNTILPMMCRLDALAAQDLPEAAQTEIAAVRHAVDYLRQLSQGLHHFALDRDSEHRAGGITDLAGWWVQASPLLRTSIPKGITLESDIPEDLPLLGIAPNKLSQMVLNLVSNAAEAIEGDGHIEVIARANDKEDALRISVSDNGRGMTVETRRLAIEPFFTTKTRGISTGLGLALVHGVAKGAGGSVDIDSEPGKGTTIHVTLPTATTAAAAAAAPTTEEAPNAPASVVGISLQDKRMAAYASLLVRSAGLQPQMCEPDNPGACRIWIAEPGPTNETAARAFLDGDPRRRVILLGDPTRVTLTGGRRYHFVDRRSGPDAMRRELRQVVFQVLEEDDEQDQSSLR